MTRYLERREKHVMVIPRGPYPGLLELYLRWWFMVGKRFLSRDAAHAGSWLTQVLVEATRRVSSAHLPVSQVDDVPDNRRLELLAMEDDEDADGPPQRIRRMPEIVVGRRSRGGKGRRGHGARGDGDGGGGKGKEMQHVPLSDRARATEHVWPPNELAVDAGWIRLSSPP
ncbi:hypothetical protein PIB30_022477 [Stylosanthes scabra]|uniref:Uncharacterized protein n=1 Tax=Stylosanthes scabra TaxID=79078 RepID=A0ABU6T8X1_9FABA|nr:hypothetical protein [Stylosanthes scabra]